MHRQKKLTLIFFSFSYYLWGYPLREEFNDRPKEINTLLHLRAIHRLYAACKIFLLLKGNCSWKMRIKFSLFWLFPMECKAELLEKAFFSQLEMKIERKLCIVCALPAFYVMYIFYFYKYLINFSENYMNRLQKENSMWDMQEVGIVSCQVLMMSL